MVVCSACYLFALCLSVSLSMAAAWSGWCPGFNSRCVSHDSCCVNGGSVEKGSGMGLWSGLGDFWQMGENTFIKAINNVRIQGKPMWSCCNN